MTKAFKPTRSQSAANGWKSASADAARSLPVIVVDGDLYVSGEFRMGDPEGQPVTYEVIGSFLTRMTEPPAVGEFHQGDLVIQGDLIAHGKREVGA